jgi:hypothetical protein
VSEATGADIEHLGLERGHRTLVITRKGGKVAKRPRSGKQPGRHRRSGWAVRKSAVEATTRCCHWQRSGSAVLRFSIDLENRA